MGNSKNPKASQPDGEVQNAATAPIPQLRDVFSGKSQSHENDEEVKQRLKEEARKSAVQPANNMSENNKNNQDAFQAKQPGTQKPQVDQAELERRREELARKKAEAEARVKAARKAEAESRAELAKRAEMTKAAAARREAALEAEKQRKAAAEKREAEKREAQRQATEKAAAEKREAEKREAQRQATEKAAAEQREAEKREAQRQAAIEDAEIQKAEAARQERLREAKRNTPAGQRIDPSPTYLQAQQQPTLPPQAAPNVPNSTNTPIPAQGVPAAAQGAPAAAATPVNAGSQNAAFVPGAHLGNQNATAPGITRPTATGSANHMPTGTPAPTVPHSHQAQVARQDHVEAKAQSAQAAQARVAAEGKEATLEEKNTLTKKEAKAAKKAAKEAKKQRRIEAARANAAKEAQWAREAYEKAAAEAAASGATAGMSAPNVHNAKQADANAQAPNWQSTTPENTVKDKAETVANDVKATAKDAKDDAKAKMHEATEKAKEVKDKATDKAKETLKKAGLTDGNAADTIDDVIPGEARPANKLKDATSSAKDKASSIGVLISKISDQAHNLVQGEIELAKARGKAMITRISKGAVLLIVAGILALYLLGVLLHAAVLGFSTIVAPWAAALIVAGILLLIIVVLALVGGLMLKKGTQNKPDPKTGMQKSVDAFKKGLNK